MHSMWKRLGKEPFINAEVIVFVILILLGCFPRRIWWEQHHGLKGKQLLVVPFFSIEGPSMLITTDKSFGIGARLGSLRESL